MADTGEGAALPTLTITEGGVTVEMTLCGWRDLVEIPAAFEAMLVMPLKTKAQETAFGAAMLEFASRLDAYATGPVKPSRVPAPFMRSFIRRWTAGVRDAAVDPPSAGTSRSRASKPSRAARPRSPRS